MTPRIVGTIEPSQLDTPKTARAAADEDIGSGAGSSPLFMSKSKGRAALASAAKNSDAAASPGRELPE